MAVLLDDNLNIKITFVRLCITSRGSNGEPRQLQTSVLHANFQFKL